MKPALPTLACRGARAQDWRSPGSLHRSAVTSASQE